jgi:hypothetical protein
VSKQDRIRELAYLKWEKAGYPPGDGVNFWVEAEQELELADGQAASVPPTVKKKPSSNNNAPVVHAQATQKVAAKKGAKK